MFDALIVVLKMLGFTMYYRSSFCERWRSADGTVGVKLDYGWGRMSEPYELS